MHSWTCWAIHFWPLEVSCYQFAYFAISLVSLIFSILCPDASEESPVIKFKAVLRELLEKFLRLLWFLLGTWGFVQRIGLVAPFSIHWSCWRATRFITVTAPCLYIIHLKLASAPQTGSKDSCFQELKQSSFASVIITQNGMMYPIGINCPHSAYFLVGVTFYKAAHRRKSQWSWREK